MSSINDLIEATSARVCEMATILARISDSLYSPDTAEEKAVLRKASMVGSMEDLVANTEGCINMARNIEACLFGEIKEQKAETIHRK